MVVGLLSGLGKLFELELSVTQVADRATGSDHDEFLIEYSSPRAGPGAVTPGSEQAPPAGAVLPPVALDA
jgi:hypothetical protein